MAEDAERAREGGGPKRLPYEPPAITWDEHLPERPGLTMACGKVDGSLGGDCALGTPSS